MADIMRNNQSVSLSDKCHQDMDIIDLQLVADSLIKEQYFYSTSERLIILVLYPILFAIGFIGNFGFLVVVLKIPNMRTITNVYLANLAVADVLFIVVTVYDILYGYFRSPSIKASPYFTSAGCTAVNAAIYVSHFASVFLILLVSIERYLAICKALKHRMLTSKGRTFKLVIFAWIAGILYTIPVAPHFGKLKNICVLWPDGEDYSNAPMILASCVPAHPFYEYIPFLIQPLPFIVATIIISIMYYKIIKKMNSRSKGQLGTESSNFDQSAQQARNRVAVLLIITAVVFFVCSLPYFVMRFNDAIQDLTNYRVGFNLSADQHAIVLQIVRGSGVINSIINPIIYSVTNQRYRDAFLNAFTCGLV